jgi:hypothetical protein
MSHVTDLKLHIKDLTALKRAAKALGMELVKQDHFKWYGTHVGDYPLPQGFKKEDMGKCDYALRIPGKPHAYEVGICKRRDGKPGFVPLYDFFAKGYGLMDVIGASGEKLKSSYAVEVAKTQMAPFQREGFRMQQFKRPDGTLVIKAVKG